MIYLAASGESGRSLYVTGDIRLVQKQPLSHRGHDLRFHDSPLPSVATGPQKLTDIVRDYAARNVSIRLDNAYQVWSRGAGAQKFVVEVDINYPVESVEYRPGLWQVVKWGWVQYLSVLVIFIYLFNCVKTFVFSKQIVPTVQLQVNDVAPKI